MSSTPIKVLLVDDDKDDYSLIRDLLSEGNVRSYSIDWINSFSKALETISEHRHDVYLLDFWLGSHNGLELLKEAHARGCNGPMILLTSLGDEAVDMEAMRAGAADFLCKGEFTSKSLERSIRYAIERSHSEQEIQKLAAFPRSNPNPVLEFASDGSMIYSNDAAQKLALSFGKNSLEEILPTDTRLIVMECLVAEQSKNDLQTTLQRRTLSWSFIPIAASNTVHCYAKEITERLKLEMQVRQSAKMEAVGQLAAGVAHDFNNILTIIQGHSEMLSHKQNLGAENQKPVLEICNAAERAGKIIRQLLMFSRKHVLQQRQMDLNEVISTLMNILKGLIGEGVTLEFHPDPNLSVVHADGAMIEQTLVNIALNAKDAMPNGGSLIITTKEMWMEPVASNLNPEAHPGPFVCLSIKDTGCGMDAETLSHAFEPFFTTKELGKGAGMGLATVYGIVKQHQGWVVVDSQVGVGTTFSIFLPSLSKKRHELHDPQPLNQDAIIGGHEGILVVEDETALRDLVVSVLTEYGYKTFHADTGVAALKIWEEHKKEIDLLLTDMMMPEGMSGPKLAENLIHENPDLKVIYTTGYSPGLLMKDLALLEGHNFLPKPYKPYRLAQMVRECFDQKTDKSEKR